MDIRIPSLNNSKKSAFIEINVDYEKGGMTWLSTEKCERGIYLYVKPIEIKDGLISLDLTEAKKYLLKELNRRSRKQIDRFTGKIEGRAEDIAHDFELNGPDSVFSHIRDIVE